MGIIRMVKESDYDFIYKSMFEYNFEISNKYEKYFLKTLFNNKFSLTLVYEEDGQPKAYHSVMTHPKSFIEDFYKNMPLIHKFKYMVKNQLNNLNSGSKQFDKIPEKYRTMIENFYNMDSNYVVSIAVYSISKTIILNHLAILTYRMLKDSYKWSIGLIRKDNKVALISNKMLYGKSMELFDLDSEVMCDIVDIEKFLNMTENFKIHHEIRIQYI